jgi:hypothetical protein
MLLVRPDGDRDRGALQRLGSSLGILIEDDIDVVGIAHVLLYDLHEEPSGLERCFRVGA